MTTKLVHFVTDGFTVNDHVYYRGEHLEVDLEKDSYFAWTPDEQISKYGTVFWQDGVWGGALYDTTSPDLSDAEKSRLEEANKKILDLREEQSKSSKDTPPQTGDTPKRGRTPAPAK